MTRVKICGIMNEKDIEICAGAGVLVLGFVVDYPVPVPWNLTPERARELSFNVNKALEAKGFAKITEAMALDSQDAAASIEECDVVINTTSAGMYPKVDDSPLQGDFRLRRDQIVYDVIYNPAETKLLAHAKRSGCRTVNGAGMLFYQGVRAFEIWTGMEFQEKMLRELLLDFTNYLTE
jgi:shikimate dehydrogenase